MVLHRLLVRHTSARIFLGNWRAVLCIPQMQCPACPIPPRTTPNSAFFFIYLAVIDSPSRIQGHPRRPLMLLSLSLLLLAAVTLVMIVMLGEILSRAPSKLA